MKPILFFLVLLLPLKVVVQTHKKQLDGTYDEIRRRRDNEGFGLVKPRLVTWDVGQGQWVTLITATHCYHFDMGGEWFPLGIKKACANKENEISLTHWDMDHISFIFRFKSLSTLVCIRDLPKGPHRWKKWILKWPRCTTPSDTREVYIPDKISKARNENSLAFLIGHQVLVTGDAPVKEERHIYFPSKISSVWFLVAGHHGSATSTSAAFLNRLKNLKQVVASARFEKYRHPHPKVIARLKIHQVPIVSTNDWGNLMIDLK